MKILKNLLYTGLLAGVLILPACNDFVQEVDPPIDVADSEELTTEEQVPFFINGVIGRFAVTHDQITVLGCGLSDACVFLPGVVNDATFPSYQQIEVGDIAIDNNSVDGMFNPLGQARFLADDLLSRVEDIEFEDTGLDSLARYTGNLYGGLTRYFYAAYIGLNPNEGGGVIDAGPFIPSSEMYGLAQDRLEAALTTAAGDYEKRIINSLIGRIQLYQGNYSAAQPFLDAGLTNGDAPFVSLHSLQSQNFWDGQAGEGRNQWTLNSRFAGYIDENPQEANRVLLENLPTDELADGAAPDAAQRQTKYGQTTSLPIITWQENHLMLAELAVRSGNPATALTLINKVRDSYNIDPFVGVVTIDVILEERDKELFATGNRLLDQRRTDNYHLGASAWRYLPITQSERNENPNLDDTQ